MTTCSETMPVPRDLTIVDSTACQQKCLYWYNYSAPSSCLVTNNTDRLTVKYDGGGDVTYNTMTFTPTVVQLFSPSLHTFNGKQTAGELVIQHDPKSASVDGLLVCIPLISEGEPTLAGEIVQTIIEGAPAEANTSATITVQDFNLNNVIPQAPFFAYTGPLMYDACAATSNYQYVVFQPIKKGSIAIDKTSLETLQTNIQFSYITASQGDGVFYNAKGTSSNGFNGEGQIFIQCQPAGQSDEEVVYKDSSGSASTTDYSKYVKNALLLLVGIVVAIALVQAVKYAINYVGKNENGKGVKADSNAKGNADL